MIQLKPDHDIGVRPAREAGHIAITIAGKCYILPAALAYTLADRIADSLQEARK
ncbi:hypothetical protein [Tsukamurella sp. USMM236]|uniref:hypothetical protein n=1 Tax=Tsukamurella sp. USMM236 TaxID=3081301 RepID=UPI003017F275